MNPTRSQGPRRPTVYPSGVDLWIAVVLIAAPFSAVAFAVNFLIHGRQADALILVLAGVVTLIVTMAFTVPCRYTILPDELSVRCGIICYQIPLDQIESIERSRTLLSGPALSMRRVVVTTNKRKKHILSPRERDEFIEDLGAAVAATQRA